MCLKKRGKIYPYVSMIWAAGSVRRGLKGEENMRDKYNHLAYLTMCTTSIYSPFNIYLY